jgi:hypothetical protein
MAVHAKVTREFMSIYPKIRGMLLLIFLILLAACATVRGQDQRWKFVVFGDTISFWTDSSINEEILAELAPAIVAENPAFVLFDGDFSGYPALGNYQIWTNLMGPVYQAGIPVYPAVGNHDYQDRVAYAAVFESIIPANGPPGEVGTTYVLNHRNALILVLNEFALSNSFRINQEWVDAVLATNTQPHVFAAGHMPAFKVYHGDCLDDYPTNRNALWHSLERARCGIYFSGHDHFYDHSRIDNGDGNPAEDIHQMTVGTGGAPLYGDGLYDGDNGPWIPVRVFHESQYGYVCVEIDGAKVTATWHHRAGTNSYPATSDVFSYSVLPRPILKIRQLNPGLSLSWTGDAILQAASDPHGGFTNVPGATSPWMISELSEQRLFFRLRQP